MRLPAIVFAVAVGFAVFANQWIASRLDPRISERHPIARIEPPLPLSLDRGLLAKTLGIHPPTVLPPPPPTPTSLKLLGTLEPLAAALVEPSSGLCRTLQVGDQWGDLELIEVTHRQITVRRGGRLEPLSIGAIAQPPASARKPLVALNAAGAILSISRAELEGQLPAFIDRFLAGGRLGPSFTGSTLTGMKLFAVRPGSLFEELGLRNGDILEAVNGTPLASLDLGVAALTQLRNQNQIRVAVNRGGEHLTWELNVN